MNTSEFGLQHADQLVDPQWVASSLSTGLLRHESVLSVRPEYLRLKPDTSLLVLYRVTVAPRGDSEPAEVDTLDDLWIHGLLGDGSLVDRERAKWDSLHPSLGPSERFVQMIGESDLLFARFPYDLGLRRLPGLSIPQRMKRLHEEVGFPLGQGEPCEVRARGAKVEVLSYRPRRRCVVRWTVRTKAAQGPKVTRRAVVRLLDQPSGHGLRWRREGELFAEIPRLFGADESSTVLFEEDLGTEAWSPSMVQTRLEEVGSMLGRLHRWSSARLRPDEWDPDSFDRQCDLDVAAALSGLGFLAPELRSERDRVLQLWKSSQEKGPLARAGHWTGIHGDVHCHQFVARQAPHEGAARGPALVDLDRSRPGPAEYDLASLLADLSQRDHEDSGRLSDRLIGAWTGETGQLAGIGLLERYTACALLKSAADPLRRFAPGALDIAQRRLQTAREILEAAFRR